MKKNVSEFHETDLVLLKSIQIFTDFSSISQKLRFTIPKKQLMHLDFVRVWLFTLYFGILESFELVHLTSELVIITSRNIYARIKSQGFSIPKHSAYALRLQLFLLCPMLPLCFNYPNPLNNYAFYTRSIRRCLTKIVVACAYLATLWKYHIFSRKGVPLISAFIVIQALHTTT